MLACEGRSDGTISSDRGRIGAETIAELKGRDWLYILGHCGHYGDATKPPCGAPFARGFGPRLAGRTERLSFASTRARNAASPSGRPAAAPASDYGDYAGITGTPYWSGPRS